MKVFKIQILAIGILLGGFLLINARVSAQTSPELIITWQSNNYAPLSYQGKIIPIRETPVSAALMFIDNNKIINISNNEIRWFLDRDLIKKGAGIASIDFTVPSLTADNLRLKAEIRNYKGKNIEKSIILPTTEPEIIIDAPYPKKTISAEINTLKALPYFFNIKKPNQLSFIWSANGQKTKGAPQDPYILKLDISGGRGEITNLSVEASNNLNNLEFARYFLNLEIK